MIAIDVVVIGGGQAGLAMSRSLSDRGIEHVVLERGQIGERWRNERWDSLRLLTPNWQTRLPGFAYDGADPHGYMTSREVVGLLERYAVISGAPIQTGVAVKAVRRCGDGLLVVTTAGKWDARVVVVATGHSDLPLVPSLARTMPGHVRQVTPMEYRRPSDLPDAGVLVVGASATGVQLADEIAASGRRVVIAAGHHTRLPRWYRGRDIMHWLDAMGVLSESSAHVFNLEISRSQPSLQLAGRDDRASLDLGTLASRGVTVTGRLRGVDGYRIHLEDDLIKTTVASDVKLALLLHRIDRFIEQSGLDAPAEPPIAPLWPDFRDAATSIDLRSAGIGTVIWATGYRRSYPWLKVPVLDDRGEIRHNGGITAEPGLYVLGLHFLRRRNSSFIDGVGADAQAIAQHIAGHLQVKAA